MVRWLGTGLAVAVLVLAVTELSCLAGDRSGLALGEPASAVSEPAAPFDMPVRFEVDHGAPGAGPALTR